MSKVYGLRIGGSEFRQRGVIGEVETSSTGNVILRVGRSVEKLEELTRLPSWAIPADDSGTIGWEQTEHIVLTPEEAEALAREILANLDLNVSTESAYIED